jgi:cobalt-precorrin 5A hydrolase
VNTAVLSLSNEGARIAQRLIACGIPCDVFLHADVSEPLAARRFTRVADLAREIFPLYRRLVFVMPLGVVVRAIAMLVADKTTDPAVVAVDVGGRWAVSLLSGHEGGANDLALAVANALGAEPVISTSSEAARSLIVGIGCRRGAQGEAIVAAVREALAAAGCALDEVRLLASADIKADEPGLQDAARELGLPLRLIASDEIRATVYAFEPSKLAQEKVDLPAVAEPAALLAGRRTRLLLPRQVLHGVTVAIARENSWSSASAPAARSIEPSAPSPRWPSAG